MLEKRKCPNCGLKIDSDLETCPYCGHILNNQDNNENKEVNIGEPTKEIKKETIKGEIFYFLLMLLGVNIIAFIVEIPFIIFNPSFIYSSTGLGVVNFIIYFVLFGVILLFSSKHFKHYFGKFKDKTTYIKGIKWGIVLIGSSVIYSIIKEMLFPEIGDNNNQTSVLDITSQFPILSTIVFGLIGPICEEFGYRVGLFGLINKKNKVVAYIVSAIIFGLIHFDFTSEDILTEIINIPDYMISGLILCRVYDKYGVETSIVSHATNNLTSIILSIILSMI